MGRKALADVYGFAGWGSQLAEVQCRTPVSLRPDPWLTAAEHGLLAPLAFSLDSHGAGCCMALSGCCSPLCNTQYIYILQWCVRPLLAFPSF